MGAAGLSSSQMGSSGNFIGWNFNTWNATAFASSANADPWYMATVYPNGGTAGITAPILVADLPQTSVTITADTGSAVYTGAVQSPGYTQSGVIESGGAVTVSSAGPNVGTYTITPTATENAPTTQSTPITNFTLVSGTWTITPAALSLSTTGTKVYDGTTSLDLTGADTQFTGIVAGQSGGLGTTVIGTLNSSSNVGTNFGGTVTLANSDLTGNGAFTSALAAGDYTLPSTFTGGSITPLSVLATATPTDVVYGSSIPALSGTLATSGPQGGLANLSASWSTTATDTSSLGSYPITPSYSYNNGAVAGDFVIDSSPSNRTALTITPLSSSQKVNQTVSTTIPDINATTSVQIQPATDVFSADAAITNVAGLDENALPQETKVAANSLKPVTVPTVGPARSTSSEGTNSAATALLSEWTSLGE